VSSNVEQIKARLSIVDVLGTYLKLEKAGVNYKAKCPFHNEKTPSFFISPARDTYHCFGCAKGGDIFSFVQEIEGVDFMGSLKILAEKAGVELSMERAGERTERSEKEKLLAALRDAMLMYRAALAKNPSAREYVERRGITHATVERFEIGYAPDGWRVVHEFLKGRGHADQIVEKTGLIIPAPKGGYYDRFRARIMFPIHDQIGNVIGFSGRVLTDEVPKYINSPQTPLFDKSKVLYGIDKAKLAIRKEDKTVLVEGQMDLVLSHQAGIEHAVAVSGTALSDEHLKSLGRLSSNVVMAFDADNAGIKASGRALGIALGLGMTVKIALLPKGKDPADLVREDPQIWQRAIAQARHVIDFFIDVHRVNYADPAALRKAIETDVLPYIALLSSPLDQGHYVSKVSSLLSITDSVIWDAIKKIRVRGPMTKPEDAVTINAPAKTSRRTDRVIRTLAGIIAWQESKPSPEIDTGQVRAQIAEIGAAARLEQEVGTDPAHRSEIILEAEIGYEGSPKLAAIIGTLLHALKEDLLTDQFSAIMRQLHEAERSGQEDSAKALLADIQKITAQLAALKKERYTADSST